MGIVLMIACLFGSVWFWRTEQKKTAAFFLVMAIVYAAIMLVAHVI